MVFTRVCAVGDLGESDLESFMVEGWEVLVIRDRDGDLHAVDGMCPHEDFPLVYGEFDGRVLTCANHLWSFDAATGQGINPPGCRLTKYAVKVDDGSVYVDTDAPPPLASTPPRVTESGSTTSEG